MASLSPDGTELVAAVATDGIFDRNGGGEVRTVATPGRMWSPTWSPDGRTIAYLADSAPFSEQIMVATVSADGTDHRVIASDRPLVSTLSYSPDGTSLVINRIHQEPLGISLVDAATGAETLLVAGPHTWSPRWSSVGRSLYWVHDEEVWTGRFDGERLVDRRQVELQGLNLDGGYLSNLDVGPC